MTSSRPVVLITVDTLRIDRLTRDCFPETMPALERDFATFTNGVSHGNATPLAFPGIMTANHVVGDGMFVDGAKTIAERFTTRPCVGFSNNGHLSAARGYDRGFDMFHDLVTPDPQSLVDRIKRIDWLHESKVIIKGYKLLQGIKSAIENRDSNTVLDPFPNPKTTADEVTDFVQRRLNDTPSAFVWGHYMDPHKPFHPDQAVDGPEIDRSREEIKYLNSYEHEKDPIPGDDMAFLEALYESNIRYFDREFARLLEWLQERDLYDDALIVMVGDHGELFGEHGMMFHPMDIDPVDELLRTPLLVKYPGGENAGESFDHLVQHADILPTIAEEMELSGQHLSDHVYPLTDTTPRSVVSKSNVSIRLTEPDAVAFKRRNGTEEGMDKISTEGRRLLENAEFPDVKTSDGEVKGVEEAERQKQLEALGYR